MRDPADESALIGIMLISAAATETAISKLTAADFTGDHGQIFQTVADMYQGYEIEPTALVAKLKQSGMKNAVGVVARLIENSGFPHNVDWYCQRILSASIRRRLEYAGHAVLEIAADEMTDDHNELLQRAHGELTAVENAANRAGESVVSIASINATEKERFRLQPDIETLPPIRTGLTALDSVISGVSPRHLVIVAARPGNGKTSLACNLAENMGYDEKRVLFFSQEMGRTEIHNRLAFSMAKIDSRTARQNKLSDDERDRLYSAFDDIGGFQLWVDETRQPVQQMLCKARILKRRHGLDAIFVDYLQYVKATDSRAQRYEQVGQIANDLKEMAKLIKVPVIAMAQLKRETDNREPRLSDLRESGDIEAAADMVIMIHQHASPADMRASAVDDCYKASFIIGKNREGPTGKVEMIWFPVITRFTTKAPEHFDNYEPSFAEYNNR